RQRVRSAGRRGLLPAVRAVMETFPDDMAAGDQARAARARFGGFRPLEDRSSGAELAGLHSLRVPPPGAHDSRQHGRAYAAASAARAWLGARLPAQRCAPARAAHLMAVRSRADVFPDDADLVD